MMISLAPVARAGSSAAVSSPSSQEQATTASTLASMSAYVGRPVKSIDLPRLSNINHFLSLLPQKAGQPLDRDQVRDSIRILFATGRFADIQAEVTPSGPDVLLSFVTSPNFFVGAVDVEGATNHPSYNQIVNASKFDLGRHNCTPATNSIGQCKTSASFCRERRLLPCAGIGRKRVQYGYPAGQSSVSHYFGRARTHRHHHRHRAFPIFPEPGSRHCQDAPRRTNHREPNH